jgi:hypothetical protein
MIETGYSQGPNEKKSGILFLEFITRAVIIIIKCICPQIK